MNRITNMFGFVLVALLLATGSAIAQEEPAEEQAEPQSFQGLPDNYVVTLALHSKDGRDELSFVVGSQEFSFRTNPPFVKFSGKLHLVDNKILMNIRLLLEKDSSESSKIQHDIRYEGAVQLKDGKPVKVIMVGEVSVSLTVRKLKSP